MIKVHATASFVGGRLRSTRLKVSDSFSWAFEGDFSQRQATALNEWFEQYSVGAVEFYDAPLFLEKLTPFQRHVLNTLQSIPFGQTVSYKELARLSGRPQAARPVGGVCNKNPYPLLIPCHRVIATGGGIGGFALDRSIKEELLTHETRCFSEQTLQRLTSSKIAERGFA